MEEVVVSGAYLFSGTWLEPQQYVTIERERGPFLLLITFYLGRD